MIHPAAKLPDLVNGETGRSALVSRVFFLGKDDEIGVGTGVERPFDPLEAEHFGRGRGHCAKNVGDAGAGPFEEVVGAFDQGDGAGDDGFKCEWIWLGS